MNATIPAIYIHQLCKSYAIPQREAGIRAAWHSLLHRRIQLVVAVDNLSFEIAPGEIVGLLGPNGAGKTTSFKILAGLLHPTSGQAQVLGHLPWQRDRHFLRQITFVMGQRNQLVWDIPSKDSFELHRAIYGISRPDYHRTLDELVDLLDLASLLTTPVRNLSLGERMKCEIALALLHQPRVLFLDEPTLGLDVTMQRRIRAFIQEYNRRYGATVLLSSHYMADIAALCRRVIVIHHGQLIFDGELTQLAQRIAPHKTILVQLKENTPYLSSYGQVIASENGQVTLRVPKAETARVISQLMADLPVTDLTVAEPSIEDVVDQLFSGTPG